MNIQVLIFVSILLTTLNGFTKTPEQFWQETGLNISHGFSSVLTTSNCQKSKDHLFGCLISMNYLAGEVTPSQKIEFDAAKNRFNLVPVDKDGILKHKKSWLKLKSSMAKLTESPHLKLDLETTINNLKKSSKSLPKIKEAKITANIINITFSFTSDGHKALLPKASVLENVNKKRNKYVGIGAHVGRATPNDGFLYLSPMKDSPAEQAGVLTDDRLIAINGKKIDTMPTGETIRTIRGAAGTKVTLTVLRGKTKEVSIVVTRNEYSQDLSLSSTGKVLNLPNQQKVGYLLIPTFYKNNLCQEFINYIKKTDKNVSGYIFDLRNNLGGSLPEVGCMLDQLVSNPLFYRKKMLSLQTVSAGKLRKVRKNKYFTDHILTTKPIVVLINKFSASASEIFAGVLQDTKRAWLVGEDSYGKGSVQTMRPTGLWNHLPAADRPKDIYEKSTTHLYALSSGRLIDGVGISPDFPFNLRTDIKTKPRKESNQGTGAFVKLKKWHQTRPGQVSTMQDCIHQKNTFNQEFQELKADQNLWFFTNDLQKSVAKDIFSCELNKKFNSNGKG